MKAIIIFTFLFLVHTINGFGEIIRTKSNLYTKGIGVKDSSFAKKLIESGNFEFTVTSVTGNPSYVSIGYFFLRINGKTAEAYLPFFGESQRGDLSGEGGINFNSLIIDYKVIQQVKKGRYSISFKINDRKDSYRIYLDVFNDGQASLRINSLYKTSMAYIGKLGELPKSGPHSTK